MSQPLLKKVISSYKGFVLLHPPRPLSLNFKPHFLMLNMYSLVFLLNWYCRQSEPNGKEGWWCALPFLWSCALSCWSFWFSRQYCFDSEVQRCPSMFLVKIFLWWLPQNTVHVHAHNVKDFWSSPTCHRIRIKVCS